MPGNSQRKGSIRKDKKGATVGSGGQRRKQLKGRGPTPKATEREKHPAARRASAAAKRAGSKPNRSSSGGRGGRTRRGGAEYVVGRNSVVECLTSGVPATALYVAERIDGDDRVTEAIRLANKMSLPLLEAPRPELDRIADGLPHQGLVLQVPPYEYANADDLLERAGKADPLIVALDHITDPRNLGAIVRSAAAFRAHGVVIPERRAAGMTAAAWKTASGAASRIPVAQVTNMSRQLVAYQKAGLFVVGLDADAEQAIDEVAADLPMCLVVGAEGPGLSRLVKDTCDIVAKIPISADTESLNASVAAGIALHSIGSRRQQPQR